MQRFFQQLLPFIFIGCAIVLFAIGLIILAYAFLFGALLGFALFAVAWVRNKLFAPKPQPPMKRRGRTFDSDDWKKM